VRAQPVRVVQLTDFVSRYPGSFIPALAALARAGRRRGLAFQAVFGPGAERRDWYRQLACDGLQPTVAPAMGRRARAAWLRALLAQAPGPVILHTHFAYWDIAAVQAARRAAVPTAVVWHRHGTVTGRIARARRAARFALLSGRVDAHVCVSRAVHDEAIALRSAPERTLVIPNGIDLARFAPAPEFERARARQQLGLPAAGPVLLAFVWDWRVKGGELLLQALARLRAGGEDALLLLVGGGEQARERVAALGLQPAVRLLEPQPDVRPLYAAAQLFVSGSEREGMPFALLEAIASGVPALASDIEPHRELAARLPACRLSPRRPDAFADALAGALRESAAAREERLRAARAALQREAGLDVWAARVLDVYRQVLEKVAPGA